MTPVADAKLAAPCGLYCGACIDILAYKSCHGCGCSCGKCAATEHHKQCNIYECCVNEKRLSSCSECSDFPCTQLTHFCYSPVWMHHFPVIENLKRRGRIGLEKWLEEQRQFWENEWYRHAWLWFQKECEERLTKYLESKTLEK